jgi:Ca2+/Na+ antiporter
MESILTNYFLPRIISLAIGIFLGYFIYKKEISRWFLVLIIPIALIIVYLFLSSPGILNNIDLYKKLENVNSNEIKKIRIFEKSFANTQHEPEPHSLRIINDKTEIERILRILNKNQSWNGNRSYLRKILGMDLVLIDDSRLSFTIYKTDDGIYLDLLNEKDYHHFSIGTYKNNELRTIIN